MIMKKGRWAYLTMILFIFFCLEGCVCANKKSDQKYFRYRRVTNTVNGFKSYLDIVGISNYKNKTTTVDSFVKLAFNYIDTAKADNPIGFVIFIGQKTGECLPKPYPDNYDDQVKNYLVGIYFNYAATKKSETLVPQLSGIMFWRNQEKHSFLDIEAYDNEGKVQLDSALKSKMPLDNGF